jgi:diacylglycerol kinase family enzyme
MQYKVIVNPLAGRGFGAQSTPTIERLLAEHGLDFDLVATTYAGEAVEMARQAVLDDYDVVGSTAMTSSSPPAGTARTTK